MSKKIKVHLQYPWKFPDSPYYKYLIESPPKEIEYQNIEKQKGVITSKRFFWFSNFLKKRIRKSLNNLNSAIPNAHLSPAGDHDLIHCAHCLSKNKDKPWLADMESYFSLFLSGELTKKGNARVRDVIMSANCKAILPWTEFTKEEILEHIPEIKEKLEVVYPAVPFKGRTKKVKKKVKIIYAARYFWLKGGLIALEVLSHLQKKYDLEIVFVAEVPEELRKKYSNLSFREVLPQKEFLRNLSESDIFFYPSLVDTFGFGILEAMSFGVIPVAINCTGTSSSTEIINSNVNGILVEAPYYNYEKNEVYDACKFIGPNEKIIIKNLLKEMSFLIENPVLREKMSKNCLKEIKSGKFSIKERNKKLKRIYKEALEK